MHKIALYVGGFVVLFGVLTGSAYAAWTEQVEFNPEVTIYATPAEIQSGGSSTLTWTSKSATSCTASGAWDGAKSRNGSKRVSPTMTSTYQLTCKRRGGSTTVSVTVVVTDTPTQPPPPQPPQEPPAVAPTTTPPVSTTTPPLPPPEPPATTTPPTPPTAVVCPVHSAPSCGGNSFVTTGPTDSNGCIGAPRCTQATVMSAPQYLVLAGATKPASNSEYGGTGITGLNAYNVSAPITGTTTITVSSLPVDARKVWWLTGKVGLSPVVLVATTTTPRPPTGGGGGRGNIQGATYGGSVAVTIVATAQRIDATDKDSEVLFSGTLTPQTGVQDLKIPLGVWAMRPGLTLTMTVVRKTKDSFNYGATFDGLAVSSFGDRPEMSMVRNDIMWAPQGAWDQIVAALAKVPVTHLHETMRTIGSSWYQAPLLKRVQDQGKKVTIVVTPLVDDIADGKSAITSPYCSWPIFNFADLSMDKYEKRLRANLDQYKQAGVNVVSFEVGNELDLFCFGSAEIPYGRAPVAADYAFFAHHYGQFLERTAAVVKRPEYYPNAKIILGAPAIDWSPAQGKLDPVQMYAPLASLNGKNYFNYVDGVGIHLYPFKNDEQSSVARARAYLAGIGQSMRPVWVSEWGYATQQYLGAGASDERYGSFRSFYHSILGISEFHVEHLSHYMLDDFNLKLNVVDSSYNLLGEARFFTQYKTPSSPTVAGVTETQESTACVLCSTMEWIDEVVADVRDYVLTLLGN